MSRAEFHIVSHMNDKVISLHGGILDFHSKLVMMPKEHHKREQLWYLDDDGCIRSAIGDFVIEAEGTGSHLQLTFHCFEHNHHWSPDGKAIINRNTGECMDIKEGSNADGTEVISWPYADQHNQHWRLEYA